MKGAAEPLQYFYSGGDTRKPSQSDDVYSEYYKLDAMTSFDKLLVKSYLAPIHSHQEADYAPEHSQADITQYIARFFTFPSSPLLKVRLNPKDRTKRNTISTARATFGLANLNINYNTPENQKQTLPYGFKLITSVKDKDIFKKWININNITVELDRGYYKNYINECKKYERPRQHPSYSFYKEYLYTNKVEPLNIMNLPPTNSQIILKVTEPH